VLGGGDPRMQAKLPEPLDLGILADYLGAAFDQDTPPGSGLRIVVVGFERDEVLPVAG
jgi:hypothetical protein